MKTIESVLFICYGNTARSPAAEYLGKYYAAKYDLELHIESAGFINAFSTMQPETHEYLKKKEILHSDFRPQLITNELLDKFDLILTMERNHRDEIIQGDTKIKDLSTKTFTLKEFNGVKGDSDIIDPYYASYSTYQRILEEIDKQVKNAIQNIKNSNES